jgi:ABC-type lipoprotein export system ATPase subunit
MVIRLLERVAHETGATVVAASHDADVISAADTRLTLGSHEERRRSPSPPRPHERGNEGSGDSLLR